MANYRKKIQTSSTNRSRDTNGKALNFNRYQADPEDLSRSRRRANRGAKGAEVGAP